MILGIVEDYTSSDVYLDDKLTGGKVALNKATNPLITLRNILAFLPKINKTFPDWESGTYAVGDIVLHDEVLYECISETEEEPDGDGWMQTSLDSLRIRAFLDRVEDRVYSELFSERLIKSDYVIDKGEREDVLLSNDYSSWVIEPKGYTSIRLNSISLESDEESIDVYLLDGNKLLDTISITPTSGVSFTNIDYTYRGFGEFRIAIDSTNVKRGRSVISRLFLNNYDIWVEKGTGDDIEDSDWEVCFEGNGMSLNISVLFDSKKYIENNVNEFSYYFRSTFEYMCFELFLTNPNVRLGEENVHLDRVYITNEIKVLQGDTVAKRRIDEKKRLTNVLKSINFDGYTKKSIYNLTSLS